MSMAFQSTHPLRDASTHPLRDATAACQCPFHCLNFNPRTPYGMRLLRFQCIIDIENFNPRTPYGMRLYQKGSRTCRKNFNPRTPYGMRPWRTVTGLDILEISIHAPLTGCDECVGYEYADLSISIHAPLTGCDKKHLLHSSKQ